MYLSTASTVLVLAILLSAVLVLGLVVDRQSTWTWQVLSQYFFLFFVLNIWLYSTHTQCTQILRVHLSTFSIYAVKINLFVVNKMKLSRSI